MQNTPKLSRSMRALVAKTRLERKEMARREKTLLAIVGGKVFRMKSSVFIARPIARGSVAFVDLAQFGKGDPAEIVQRMGSSHLRDLVARGQARLASR